MWFLRWDALRIWLVEIFERDATIRFVIYSLKATKAIQYEHLDLLVWLTNGIDDDDNLQNAVIYWLHSQTAVFYAEEIANMVKR